MIRFFYLPSNSFIGVVLGGTPGSLIEIVGFYRTYPIFLVIVSLSQTFNVQSYLLLPSS